jgi:beta-lactamase class C
MTSFGAGTCLDAARGAGIDPDALRGAFGLLEGWVEDGTLPGAAVAVTRDGQIAGEAYLGATGRAGRSVEDDTLWGLASITKTFTVTGLMLLVEAGLVGLDESVSRLLPEFGAASDSEFDRGAVTVRHLVTHCSGLPGFSTDNVSLRQDQRPLEDFIRSFLRQPLLFEPGSLHYYSSVAIGLAAEVIGRALAGTLGREVPEPEVGRCRSFLESRLLAPLGMERTSLSPPETWYDDVAFIEGTDRDDPDWGYNSVYFRKIGLPWGGMVSRPRDLVRFVDLFLPAAAGRSRFATDSEQPLVSRPTIEAMTSVQAAPPDAPAELAPELRDGTPPVTRRAHVPWGLGWAVNGVRHRFFGDLNSPSAYGHLGSMGTMAWGDPKFDVTCVLLTNRGLACGWTEERHRQSLFSNAVIAGVL